MIWQEVRETISLLVDLVALYIMLKPTDKEKKPRNRRKPRKHRR